MAITLKGWKLYTVLGVAALALVGGVYGLWALSTTLKKN